MTKIAIWCRHIDDNIIGIGPHIPWRVSSDFKRFKRITLNKNILVGEKTYESLPNKTLPDRNILVLSFNKSYEITDKKHHFVINDINYLKAFEEDLYICGGATIYDLFINNNEFKLNPEIIVDSCYMGEIDKILEGNIIDISSSVNTMKKSYIRVSDEYIQDNIKTAIYVRRGAFVEQNVIKDIMSKIEEGMK